MATQEQEGNGNGMKSIYYRQSLNLSLAFNMRHGQMGYTQIPNRERERVESIQQQFQIICRVK